MAAAEKRIQLDALVKQRFSGKKSERIAAFMERYYRFVAEEDIESKPVEDLYGAALSHWNFGQRRKVNDRLIRVINPDVEEQGWQSEHTIVEIVVDDKPFLVQSLIMEVNRHRLTNHLVIHPVFAVNRSKTGSISSLDEEPGGSGACAEAFIHIEVDRQSDAVFLEELRGGLERVLIDLYAATEDWQPIRARVKQAIQQLQDRHPKKIKQEVSESVSFLEWLLNEHFVFLGCRDYRLIDNDEHKGLQIVADSGLGVLRDAIAHPPQNGLLQLSDDAWEILTEPFPLLVTKATTRSTIHRPVFMDYIGVRHFDRGGKVIAETRLLGLFDSAAYSASLEQIPLLGRKIDKVFQQSGFEPNSHSGRALMHVLEQLPRDELYHSNEATLVGFAMGVLQLQERQRVKIFARQDVYGQYVSVLVFVPRDRFHTDLRKQILSILMRSFEGKTSEFKVQLSESALARIHFIIHTGQCSCISYDLRKIENQIVDCLYEWKDELKVMLQSHCGEERGNFLFNRYADGVSAAYREDFSPRIAVFDIDHLENLDQDGLYLRLYRPLEMQADRLRFKLYQSGQPAALSSTLPMLENMGVRVMDERPYELTRQDTQQRVWIHDFGLLYDGQGSIDVEQLKRKFQETFEQIWQGKIENDGFNRLVLFAQLDWRHLTVLRALYFYLRQTGLAFSQAYVIDTLVNNPVVAALLVEFFEARFDPDFEHREATVERLEKLILCQIDEVKSLDEDRILRQFLNLIEAMLRTNFYQFAADEKSIPYLAFKFDPDRIQDLPAPRPNFEIFVYSPRMEGVHLRGGPVARGGLRWSDRREDFRTEILGLMKAQVSKNALIVPTGAKGGFVAKQLDCLPAESVSDEVKACYQTFIRGLLDVTDNIVNDQPVHPPSVVCYDERDPYLVVAADKGTAAFSDIANQIADDYKFWLGDAFASGGSVGYDHKKMGITARGAWESVLHHLHELGLNLETETVSAVGIGDMSGDVFGNGMLQSDRIRLIGAFNHKDIFLDPDPDPEVSFAERKRLFGLARSSWSDYDKKKISSGGGVYSRQLKSIALSTKVRQAFGVKSDKLTPNQLIQVILKAPVDLLWNGGIGTYVKSTDETDMDVGDRSNDAVRVDAKDLRCKLIGEGGNLGFTQRGRLEFSGFGGRINSDAIDNSAGVDCSDHEVNIKIVLNRIVDEGDLTVKQRNRLLEQMTQEVAQLVLRNNYRQTRAISYIHSRADSMMDFHRRIISNLVAEGVLDRELEQIPSDESINERMQEGHGLLRPEIAVLMACCKIYLKTALLDQDELFTSKFASREIQDYFPAAIRKKFSASIENHRLRYEIVANQLVNRLINRLGIAYPFRMMDESGAGVSEVIGTYCFAVEIFDAEELWGEIENLEGRIEQSVHSELVFAVNRLIERSMSWLINNVRNQQYCSTSLQQFKSGIQTLTGQLLDIVPERQSREINERIETLVASGVPQRTACRLSGLATLFSFLDVIVVKSRLPNNLEEAAKTYFALDEKLRWSELKNLIAGLKQDSYWQSLARTGLRDDFHKACQKLTLNRVSSGSGAGGQAIDDWVESSQAGIRRYLNLVEKIQFEQTASLDSVTVMIKGLRALD